MNRVLIAVMICLAFGFSATWLEASQEGSADAKAPGQDAVYHPALNAWIPAGNVSQALPSKARVNNPTFNSSRAIKIIHSFGFPSGWLYARDAAWDGSALWIGENFNSRIYKIDPSTGNVLSSFYGPDSNPWGLAWNGVELYSATITMYHYPPGDTLPDWVYQVTTSGSKINKWEAPDSPDATPRGAAYDPVTRSLWLCDYYYDKIYEINPTNGTVLSSFTFPGTEARGLTWDGQFLYAIDGPALALLKMDTSGTIIDSVSIATLGGNPEGLTWDGTYFWVTENDTDTIYQIDAGMNEFISDVDEISEATGGTANFALNAGAAKAGKSYGIFGSVTGTSPGTMLPSGELLPLNWDIFTNLVVGMFNTGPFQSFLGTLDGSGQATAAFILPSGTGTAGVTFYFAYALYNPWDIASNPVAIKIVP